MASLLTQCPHCQTAFKVNQTQLDAAQGLVRCGACLGVFAARANVVRVKTASTQASKVSRPSTPGTPAVETAGTATPVEPLRTRPASLAPAATNKPVEPSPSAESAIPQVTAPAAAPPQANKFTSQLDFTLNSQGNFTGMLQPFGYRTGEFHAGIRDEPGLTARSKRLGRTPDIQQHEPATQDKEEAFTDAIFADDQVLLGDMQLDTAAQDEFDELRGVTPDLETLLAEEENRRDEQADSGYQEYVEYEDEEVTANVTSSFNEEGADPWLNQLPYVEVEEYEDDLELDSLIYPHATAGSQVQPETQSSHPASSEPATVPELDEVEYADEGEDEDDDLPGFGPVTDIPSTTGPDNRADNFSTNSWPADYEDEVEEVEDEDEFNFDDEISPAFGDSDLGDDPDTEEDHDLASEFANDADNDCEEEYDNEPDYLDEDRHADRNKRTSTEYEDDELAVADSLGDSEEFPDDYADEDEDLEEAEDSETAAEPSRTNTHQVRQRIIHEESSTTLNASKALLNRYLQNLEDDDALDELPLETLEYVDDEPVTISSTSAPRRILTTVGLGLLNLGLIVLIALQFINANLEQLNRSARFAVLRPYVCLVLSCPAPPSIPSSTLYSRQLLVRMHPRIRDALEVSFVFLNDSPQDQNFPGLELSFRDDNDALIASRLFTPAEYLPPELRSIAQMPGQSSVQIQLDLLDPGPQALHYSIAFRDL